MLRLSVLTIALSSVVLITSCAPMTQPLGSFPLEVRPVQETSHGLANAKAFFQLGRYYQGQRRFVQALDAYRKSLTWQPQDPDTLTAIGVTLANLGQYDAALTAFEQAAALLPNEAFAQNNLGYIHRLRGERELSLAAYTQALRLDPSNEKAKLNVNSAGVEKADQTAAASNGSEGEIADLPKPNNSYKIQTAPAALALTEVAPQIYQLAKPHKKMEEPANIPLKTAKVVSLATVSPPTENTATEKSTLLPPLSSTTEAGQKAVADGNGNVTEVAADVPIRTGSVPHEYVIHLPYEPADAAVRITQAERKVLMPASIAEPSNQQVPSPALAVGASTPLVDGDNHAIQPLPQEIAMKR